MKRARRATVAAAGLAAMALAAMAFVPAGVEVEVGRVARGPLRVTVTGTGKAQVKARYAVAAPVPGRLERIRLQAGDQVAPGDAVARIEPAAPAPLDARSRAEQRARLAAALGGEAEARSGLERARVATARAESDLRRDQTLAEAGSISQQQLEVSRSERRARSAELDMAEAALRRAQGEAEAARAVLAADPPDGAPSAGGLVIRSPVAGRVLRVLQESEGPVAAGTVLVEVGDLSALEVNVDLLTSQAVRVRPGAPVELTQWGGDRPLQGRVSRVEPSAFTKVSALGIEEQRVYVKVEPASDASGWQGLADGYQVEAEIVVEERPAVVKLPVGSLFRHQAGWAVFTLSERKARLQEVRLGPSNGVEAEVLSGVGEGERVVLHPSDKLSDGARIKFD